jgi:ATP-binding cassette subfamily F protein 3
MLHLKSFSKDFNGRQIVQDINWHLKKGERVGLVGENGAGKTTLMRIIAGQMESSAGEIQLSKGATIGYLSQDLIVNGERKLFTEVMSAFTSLQSIEKEIHELAARLESMRYVGEDQEELLHRFGHLQEEFRQQGGYAMESEAGTVLRGLGFAPADWERGCAEFSGGWQMRIALAKLLLQRPHVLLLDEPTNHLDIEARNWLEEYLKGYPHSVILVSHDRFFMDQVCHRITEVWNCTLTDYHCNYSTYLLQREERIARLREAKRRQDEEMQKIEDFIARFRYKADKAALVQSRIKQLEKMERITLPPERKRIRFRFPVARKSGKIVLELKNLTKAYGNNVVLDNIDLVVERGEKVCLVGHNGAGKSTLMHVLAGHGFQEGERLLGHNTVVDFFAQDQSAFLNAGKTVYEELLADAPLSAVPSLRDILGAFLFSGDDIHKKVEVLSGGEKNRLALAKILLRPANVLLMDEPTNHLDLFSKEVLLDALELFAGTVVFVSHDRYFIDSLATRVIEVANGKVRSFLGNYEDYLEKALMFQVNAKMEIPKGIAGSGSLKPGISASPKEERIQRRDEDKQRQRQERNRLKRLMELEAQIEEQENTLESLEQKMSDPDFFKVAESAKNGVEEHAALISKISKLYEEWEAVQENADNLVPN